MLGKFLKTTAFIEGEVMLRFVKTCGVGCSVALAVLFPLVGAYAQHESKYASHGLETLYSFCSQPNCSDGYGPQGKLIADGSGNLYGMTFLGGGGGTTNSCFNFDGCGAVFRLAPDGTETVLHAFAGGTTDGANPAAGVTMDSSGNLYGTTSDGGGGGSLCNDIYYEEVYCGIVFKLTPKGKETVLYAFQGGSDGGIPRSDLITDSSGNLYGVTYIGGGTGCGGYGCGTVFKITPKGTETILYSFLGGHDGNYPYAGLTMDGSGSLYGTTTAGGADDQGTVFKLAPDGTETILHSFTGGNDGIQPIAGVILDSSGNLYGTTDSGGGGNCPDNFNSVGCGTVFEVSRTGREKVLYAFPNEESGNGWFPEGGLIIDSSGVLHGTTQVGGSYAAGNCPDGCGTVFKLTRRGKETVRYSFCVEENCPDGDGPMASLITDSSGDLYGTTPNGGTGSYNPSGGTIFKLTK